MPITTAADDSFFYYFLEKTSLDISCELSAWQMIHMKCQDLFSLKNKKNIFECCLLQILLGALRDNALWANSADNKFIFFQENGLKFNANCLLKAPYSSKLDSFYPRKV